MICNVKIMILLAALSLRRALIGCFLLAECCFLIGPCYDFTCQCEQALSEAMPVPRGLACTKWPYLTLVVIPVPSGLACTKCPSLYEVAILNPCGHTSPKWPCLYQMAMPVPSGHACTKWSYLTLVAIPVSSGLACTKWPVPSGLYQVVILNPCGQWPCLSHTN